MARARVLLTVLLAGLVAPSAGLDEECLDEECPLNAQAMMQMTKFGSVTEIVEWPVSLASRATSAAQKFMVKLQGGKVPMGSAQAAAVAILHNQALLDTSVNSCSCGKLPPQPGSAQTCGFQWYKDDVLLPCPVESAIPVVTSGGKATKLVLFYEISSEALLEPDLVSYARELPLEPPQREKVLESLRSKGITSRAGLRSANIPEILEGAGVSGKAQPVVEQKLQKEVAKQTAAAQGSKAPAPKPTFELPMVKAVDMQKAAKQARESAAKLAKELQDAVEKEVKEGTAALNKEASDNLKAVADKLGGLENLAGDMAKEATAASSAMAAYDESKGSGTVVGSSATHKWNTQKLIDRNGILRGATLLLDLESTGQAQVVQFKEHLQVLDDAALEAQVALQPDVQTAEATITSTSASSMSQANRIIEASGYSSFDARKESMGAGLAFMGGPVTLGVGFQDNEASSSGHAEVQDNSETEQLSQMTNTLLKSRYFFEPREELRIFDTALEATPDFKQAAKEVEAMDQDERAEGIKELFSRFGTHVCPHALLGGWWRIDAKYVSATSQRGVDMSRATSLAMEEAASESFSIGVQVAGVGKGGGGGMDFTSGEAEASKDTEKASSGARLLGRYATKDGVLDIQQEWKGGMSGGTPTSWRASLDRETNAYWKVIDRFEGDCRGIWTWAPEGIMQEMCETWKAVFMDRLGDRLTAEEKGSLLKGCDTGDMRKARKAVLSFLSQLAQTQLKQARENCTSQDGRWWGSKGLGKAEACHLNECRCGAEVGAFGKDCPRHGDEKCRDEQLALCTTMACGAKKLHVPGAGSKRCAAPVCGNSDMGTCCRSAGLGRQFDIRIRFQDIAAMGLEGGSQLRVKLKGGGKETHWMVWGDRAGSGHETTRSVTSNVGDIEPTEICVNNNFQRHPVDYFTMDWLRIKNKDAPDSTAYWAQVGNWGGTLHTGGHTTACRGVKMNR